MGARRLGRERALQALYQLEQDPKLDEKGALDASWTAHDDEGPRDPAADTFARELIAGVKVHQAFFDNQSFSAGIARPFVSNWKVPSGCGGGTAVRRGFTSKRNMSQCVLPW